VILNQFVGHNLRQHTSVFKPTLADFLPAQNFMNPLWQILAPIVWRQHRMLRCRDPQRWQLSTPRWCCGGHPGDTNGSGERS
jgi:hypothetical protein